MKGSGIQYPHSYYSSRRPVDWNRCGQAAVATLLDYHGRDPYGLPRPEHDERDGRRHWHDGEVIDRISADHPPDQLFGLLGTTGRRISRALEANDLVTSVASSPSKHEGRYIWERVKRSVRAGLPVIAILDRGKLGGRPLAAHWGVVYRIEGSSVHLASTSGVHTIEEITFLEAFRCRFMPCSSRHCAIFVSSDPTRSI